MKITADMLREKNASEDQVKIFNQEWPNGAEVTPENCLRATKLGLDLDCGAKTFFTARVLAKYEKAATHAWAEYEKAQAPAWAEYEKAKARANAEYEKAKARAFYDAAKGK